MNDITAIIVIKGNPTYLNQSLSSIEEYVSEIIIGTINVPDALESKLKKNSKIKIFPLDESIPFADVIKEDLKQKAKGKYILYLDPDEIFPKAAFKLFEKNIDKFDYFYIPRKNFIFGKWIKHSRWFPDYQLRFFKKDHVVWPKNIHPIPLTTGQGFELPATETFTITHYNYKNLSEYFEKSLRYAKAEAKKAVLENNQITLGETFKKSLNEFFSRYFAGEGYKDGTHGFVLSILQMFYYILVYVFYWEEKKYFEIDQQDVNKEVQKFYWQGLKDTNYWLINKKLLYNMNKFKIKILSIILNLFGL